MIDSDSQNTCIQILLCVLWDTKNDALKGKTTQKDIPVKQRGFLSFVILIFNSLGTINF